MAPLLDQAPGIPLIEAIVSFGEIVDNSRVRFTRRPEHGGGTVSIDLNRCLGNDHGKLVVGGSGFANSSKNICLPYGFDEFLKVGTLRAECSKPDGSFETAELRLWE